MSELESVHEEVEDEEVHFWAEEPRVGSPTPPIPVTTIYMDVIIRGWEEKFEHLSRCLREVQLASEKANSDMCNINREGRARGNDQERRLQAMHVGLTDFLQKCEPTHLSATRQDNAPTASTPYAQSMPTGIPVRLRPEFEFQPSPVGQDEPMEPARSTISHIRDHDDIRSTRTRDHDDIRDVRIREHDTFRDTRTRDHDDIRDTRIQEHDDFRDTRTHDQDNIRDTRIREHDAFRDTRTRENIDDRDARTRELHDNRDRLNERRTHEDARGNSGDMQQDSYHTGMNSSMSRSFSSPKVPTFDGTISAQFRPWIIQFEAIARHQGWTQGERVVRLVSSLTGPAANLLIGMTLGQLDDYNFLRARLSRRYDPPEREEAHRAELRVRTRRRNESADEFAENIKNLAQRAYPSADQNMLDNLVVKHVEIGSHARKSNEGLYTVQSGNKPELTLEEVTRAARRLGFGLRPWTVRQQNTRGFNTTSPGRNQNSGEQQQSPRLNQSINSGARQQNPIRRQTPVGEIKCWTCGKTGHYASDCKSNGFRTKNTENELTPTDS